MTSPSLLLWIAASCGDANDPIAPRCDDVFFADGDGDGHGDVTDSVTACDVPDGFVTTRDDCDDGNVAVHPGADEICDGVDDDCDGTIDVDATDGTVWYADVDGDGFGRDDATAVACEVPLHYAARGGDCDDTDASVSPDGVEVCNDADDDCDALVDSDDPDIHDAPTWYADADGDTFGDWAHTLVACVTPDGFVANATDCDDTTAKVHEGVTEVCNEIDDDCDGYIDDADDGVLGDTTFYVDADGDGSGDGTLPVLACLVPAGCSETGSDCNDGDAAVGDPILYWNDTDGDGYGAGFSVAKCRPDSNDAPVDGDCRSDDASIHPGAEEVCNNTDDNCDHLVDEDDPLVVYTVWYADADGDGYGDPSSTLSTCERTDGYVRDDRDCNDLDAGVNPDGVEYCDGIDNDCDGTTDVSVVYADWYLDADGDGYGTPDDSTYDCVQPSGYVLAGGDCDDADAATSPGIVEECTDGRDDDCDGNADNCVLDASAPDALVEGPLSYLRSGSSLESADVDGDGVADVLAGAPPWNGFVYVTLGPVTGTIAGGQDGTIWSSGGNDLGDSLASGDLDDDGVADLLVGAPYEPQSAYLFLGPVTTDHEIADADAVYDDDGTGGYMALEIEIVSDVDGDGASDALIGAPAANGGKGSVYVVAGALTGAVTPPTDATYVYSGPGTSSALGYNTEVLGDVDGDGIGDMALVANAAAFVVAGGDTPGTYVAPAVASAQIGPLDGFTVSTGDIQSLGVGDQNNDGYADVVVGDPNARSGSLAGAAYAFLGPLSGMVEPGDANASWRGDSIGYWVATGDCSGDKQLDVLLGGSSNDYLALGPVTGAVDLDTLVSMPTDAFGGLWSGGLAFVPDWSGDGVDEIAVGATTTTTAAGVNAGAVYVYYSDRFY